MAEPRARRFILFSALSFSHFALPGSLPGDSGSASLPPSSAFLMLCSCEGDREAWVASHILHSILLSCFNLHPPPIMEGFSPVLENFSCPGVRPARSSHLRHGPSDIGKIIYSTYRKNKGFALLRFIAGVTISQIGYWTNRERSIRFFVG